MPHCFQSQQIWLWRLPALGTDEWPAVRNGFAVAYFPVCWFQMLSLIENQYNILRFLHGETSGSTGDIWSLIALPDFSASKIMTKYWLSFKLFRLYTYYENIFAILQTFGIYGMARYEAVLLFSLFLISLSLCVQKKIATVAVRSYSDTRTAAIIRPMFLLDKPGR